MVEDEDEDDEQVQEVVEDEDEGHDADEDEQVQEEEEQDSQNEEHADEESSGKCSRRVYTSTSFRRFQRNGESFGTGWSFSSTSVSLAL